jgi:hypothetical protein
VGIVGATGWRWSDKLSLLHCAARWQWSGFVCHPNLTVAQLCQPLSSRPLHELIAPLCVSALNTPPERASAQVFLRVLKDSLFATPGGSNLLLPRLDLSSLFRAGYRSAGPRVAGARRGL